MPMYSILHSYVSLAYFKIYLLAISIFVTMQRCLPITACKID